MKIAVIGGGISGLAAAHRLMELSPDNEVQVLESSPRPGGVLFTRRGEGYLLEEGPDSFIVDKPWALELCKRLGLEPSLIPTNPARKAHVLWDDKLHAIPEGFGLMAPSKIKSILTSPLFSLDGKARIAMERLIKPRLGPGDESVGAFVRRRLGAEALERLVQPLVSGIYGGDVNDMSMQALFPRFLEMERNHGSLSAGSKNDGPDDGTSGARYGLFVSLKDGMGTLVDALLRALPQGSVLVNAAVQSIVRVAGRWDITLDTGYQMSVDAVLMALPVHRAARLLRPIDSGVADTLGEIKCASSASVTFSYPWAAISRNPEGFGFVVPAVSKRAILGCTFSSAKFAGRAPKDEALLRAFISPSFLDRDDEELVEAAKTELTSILGLQGDPLFTSFKRHAQAMPQYTVGHAERVAAVDWRLRAIPRLTVAGNAYRGIGLPDCVKSAQDAAEALVAKLAQPSYA